MTNRVVGNAAQGDVEVRYDEDGELDEVVAKNATVHLEKMDHSQFVLIVETARERICVEVGARRAPVRGFESWRDRINRRGEAATRRWNRWRAARKSRQLDVCGVPLSGGVGKVALPTEIASTESEKR